MRTRLVLAAAAVGAIAVVLPAHAAVTAPAAVVLADLAGDGNGVNDQGFGIGTPPATATPAEDKAGDITAVKYQTIGKVKKVNRKKVFVPSGFTVTLSLGAAPDSATLYQVAATMPTCTTGAVEFDYATTTGNDVNAAGCRDGINVTEIPGVTATVKGTDITWTLPLAVAPVGSTVSETTAFTFTNTPVLLLWAIDTAAWDTVFTVGK